MASRAEKPPRLIGLMEDPVTKPDFIIWTSGEKTEGFEVHKLILGKSPVLRAMFNHEFNETTQNEMVIDDVRPSMLKQFLKYLYEGKSEKGVNYSCAEMLTLADKYNVESLLSLGKEDLIRLCQNPPRKSQKQRPNSGKFV